MKLCNGVFEGGGVRGIAHVGAACALEAAGYQFEALAGSSAGAIVAALLAAGYPCSQLKREMMNLDYRRFKGKSFGDYFGTVGKALSLFFALGIYDTDYLELWIKQMLEPKGIRTFGDVAETGRQLFITASDLTDRKLLVFPGDGEVFGLKPEEFPVALAVKASVSIPVFFEPVCIKDSSGQIHVLVDGGLLSNYPAWMFGGGSARQPTFGFQFQTEKEAEGTTGCSHKPGLTEYLKSIVATCMDAIDNNCQGAGTELHTIQISAAVGTGTGRRNIGSTEFGLTKAQQEELFENGRRAARITLSHM